MGTLSTKMISNGKSYPMMDAEVYNRVTNSAPRAMAGVAEMTDLTLAEQAVSSRPRSTRTCTC